MGERVRVGENERVNKRVSGKNRRENGERVRRENGRERARE